MSRQANWAMHTGLDEAVSGDFSTFGQVFAPGAIGHNPAPARWPDAQGLNACRITPRPACADVRVSVGRLVQNEIDVANADTFHCTRKDEFAGICPTGKLGITTRLGARVVRG